MSDLSPGDLCVIMESPHIAPHNRKYIGWHVILITTATPPDNWYGEKFAPWWRVSGLPPNYLVSCKILRRIEPPALTKNHYTDEEIVA